LISESEATVKTAAAKVVINSEPFPFSVEEFVAGEAIDRDMVHLIDRSK